MFNSNVIFILITILIPLFCLLAFVATIMDCIQSYKNIEQRERQRALEDFMAQKSLKIANLLRDLEKYCRTSKDPQINAILIQIDEVRNEEFKVK